MQRKETDETIDVLNDDFGNIDYTARNDKDVYIERYVKKVPKMHNKLHKYQTKYDGRKTQNTPLVASRRKDESFSNFSLLQKEGKNIRDPYNKKFSFREATTVQNGK